MNRPWRFQCGDLLPLVKCAENTQIGIGFGKVLARFGKPTTNSFFSIEFIEITCLKTIRAFFGIGKKKPMF
jgi:hypothetical protein